MIDDKSDPGSWAKALAELGTHGPRVLGRYLCHNLGCQWTGDQPSITDASKEVERDGHIELDRVHRPVCPRCFNLLDGPTPAPRESEARKKLLNTYESTAMRKSEVSIPILLNHDTTAQIGNVEVIDGRFYARFIKSVKITSSMLFEIFGNVGARVVKGTQDDVRVAEILEFSVPLTSIDAAALERQP